MCSVKDLSTFPMGTTSRPLYIWVLAFISWTFSMETAHEMAFLFLP